MNWGKWTHAHVMLRGSELEKRGLKVANSKKEDPRGEVEETNSRKRIEEKVWELRKGWELKDDLKEENSKKGTQGRNSEYKVQRRKPKKVNGGKRTHAHIMPHFSILSLQGSLYIDIDTNVFVNQSRRWIKKLRKKNKTLNSCFFTCWHYLSTRSERTGSTGLVLHQTCSTQPNIVTLAYRPFLHNFYDRFNSQ